MKASELVTLKAKIKAEMKRRNGYGSLETYGSNSYDFTVQPAIGVKTKPEHGQKTIDLILRIEDFKDCKKVKENDPIPEAFGDDLINEVTKLSKEAKTGQSSKTVKNLFPSEKAETSSCRGACTGLCVGTCMHNCNGCTSCTATCGTGCEGGCLSCTGGCDNTCKGTCYKDCTGGCHGTCKTDCVSCTSCTNECSGTCYSECGGTCSKTCKTVCVSCSGCANTCNSTCASSCTDNCSGNCSGCSKEYV